MGDQLYGLGGEIRNVKAFGAVGDGNAIDRIAVQAAVDDVGDSGGIVFFPRGEYRLDIPLIIPDDRQVILQGCGIGSTIRAMPPFTGDAIVKNSGAGAVGPVLRNLAVAGQRTLANVHGISFNNIKGAAVEDVNIVIFGAENADGIHWEAVEFGELRHLNISGAGGVGIYLGPGTSHCIVSDIRMIHGGDTFTTGLKCVQSSNCIFEKVKVNNSEDYGIWMEDTKNMMLNRVGLEGDQIEGFHIEGDQFSYLHHCGFNNTGGIGLAVSGSYGTHFYGGTQNGITNIDAACRLLKFNHVREEDRSVVNDSSPDTYWDSIKDEDQHSDTRRRSPALGRVIGGTTARILSGSGSPESLVTAPPGSMYLRTDGGAGTTLYIKETGSGNTGWASK